MARCTRCGARDGFFGSVQQISPSGLCPNCGSVEQEIERQLVAQAASQDSLLEQIGLGQLPILDTNLGLQLDADEFCHFYSKASYENKRQGQLFATNRPLA